jgi:hypothetical protein
MASAVFRLTLLAIYYHPHFFRFAISTLRIVHQAAGTLKIIIMNPPAI